MAATHEINIQLTGTLAATPLQPPAFGGVLFLAEDVALDGSASVLEYTNTTQLADSLAAGEINAAAHDAGVDAFSQSPKVATFYVGAVDVTGLETYSEAFTRILASDGSKFYAVLMESDAAADQVALAETLEAATPGKLLIIAANPAADGAELLLSAALTAYADLSDNERTIGIVHEATGDAPDAGLAYRLSYDLGATSPTWTGNVASMSANTDIAAGERTNILANGWNVLLPFGTSETYNDPGQTTAGRPAYEIVSFDWFLQNLRNALISLRADYDARGAKIPINAEGQAILEDKIREQHTAGVQANHFFEENEEFPLIQWSTITDADIAAERLRGTGFIRIAPSARVFALTFNFVKG